MGVGINSRGQLWRRMAGALLLALWAQSAKAYTANKVWMEFRPQGIYRVYVNYTVPELKEAREAYVEFRKKKEAEGFYFDLLRGADFYPPDPKARRFVQTRLTPEPW